MTTKKTKEQFIKELADDNIEVLGEYLTYHTKVRVRYKDCMHEEYKSPAKLLVGQRCAKCSHKRMSKAKQKNTEEFKRTLLTKGLEHIELLSEYRGTRNKINIRNNKCGHVYEAIANNVLNGAGCPICHGFKDTHRFVELIQQKYPNEYDVIGEYVNNNTPILVRHKCGFSWEVIPKDLLRDIRCPKCIMSKGELYIAKYLVERNIEHIPQYRFRDCKDVLPLPFDFMIKVGDKIKLIEFDGSHHFKKSMYHNDKVKIHDDIKNRYCQEKGIPLLRIPYWWLRNDRINRELDSFISE